MAVVHPPHLPAAFAVVLVGVGLAPALALAADALGSHDDDKALVPVLVLVPVAPTVAAATRGLTSGSIPLLLLLLLLVGATTAERL